MEPQTIDLGKIINYWQYKDDMQVFTFSPTLATGQSMSWNLPIEPRLLVLWQKNNVFLSVVNSSPSDGQGPLMHVVTEGSTRTRLRGWIFSLPT